MTSCAKKGCATATGSFETFPACPDVVPGQKEITPNVSGATELNNELLGVAAVSANDAWAEMILHWNGDAWTAVTHPRAFPNAAVLRAVATTSGGIAWSVGLEIEVSPSSAVSAERTLIDKYTP